MSIKHNFLSEVHNLTDVKTSSSQYPSITITKNDDIWVSWQSYENGTENIYAGVFENGGLKNKTIVSGDGEGFKSKIYAYNDKIIIAWSECENASWKLMIRVYDGEKWEKAICLKEGKMEFYPCFSKGTNEELWIFWTSYENNTTNIVGKKYEEDKWSDLIYVTTDKEAYRPSAALDNKGNLIVSYDCFNGKAYDVECKKLLGETFSKEVKISTANRWASQSNLIKTKSGFLVNWCDFGDSANFAYWSAELEVDNDKVNVMNVKEVTKGVNWYITLSSVNDDKLNKQYFIYNWGQRRLNLRVHSEKAGWSYAMTISPTEDNFEIRPQSVIDSKGNLWVIWQNANGNGHKQRHSKICIRSININKVDDTDFNDNELNQEPFVLPIDTEKSLDFCSDHIVQEFLDKSVCFKKKKIFWGDIHGQSGISDGLGEIDQYYNVARAKANMDFAALTDHDCFPDIITNSEWSFITTHANIFNTEKLATLLALEWTPNEYMYDYGHKNIYYRDASGPVIRSTEESGRTPDRVFASLEGRKALAFPHHPAADWGMVSAATDWSFHNPEYQRLVEIFSRHAPFEYYGNESKYTKNVPQSEGKSVRDALQRKYRLGFTAGSDSHQMEHGVEGGIIGLFADELTRENVFDSLYDRTVYGTTGARILVDFSINGSPMGSEIINEQNNVNKIVVRVLGTNELDTVEIIKNGERLYSEKGKSNSLDILFEDSDRSDCDYYYVRVVQKDEHMAWSSPIWVDEK